MARWGSKSAAMLALTAACALGAEIASATFQPTVLYEPPLLAAVDHKLHNSEEHMIVESNGRYAIAVTSTPVPMGLQGGSDPGCGFITGGLTCPSAGLKRLRVNLGPMNDSAVVDLGRFATRIAQKVIGGSGEDSLTGGKGAQRLSGGPDNDTLTGGPGPDILIGGPGDDICRGGPGKDVLRRCE